MRLTNWEITVSVELSLYLYFVASCVSESNNTYVHRRLPKQDYELSVIITVLQNLFYLFSCWCSPQCWDIKWNNQMDVKMFIQKIYFRTSHYRTLQNQVYLFTYKTVLALLWFKYKPYFHQKLDLKNFSRE